MKNGKLEPSDIGKKFTKEDWKKERFFIFHSVSKIRPERVIGEDNRGWGEDCENEDWLSYEEPKQKKRIEAAPAVFKKHNTTTISGMLFENEKEARSLLESNFIKYPADWDDVKKCWFYEWEE